MAVLYATSFEGGSVAYMILAGWTGSNLAIHSGTRVHRTLAGVGGSFAMDITGAGVLTRTPVFSTTSRWFHTYFAPQDADTPATAVFVFERSGAFTFTVRINPTGTIELIRGDTAGTVVATSAGVINRGVPHWLAIQLLAADAAGTCEVWSDGVLVVSFTGDTKAHTTLANWDQVRLVASGFSADHTIDDVIVTDSTTGRVVEHVAPVMVVDGVSSGNLTGVPVTGANRYQNVDEGGANGATSQTDYNQAVAVNDEDIYTLSDPPTPTSVLCAVFWAEAARSGGITQAEIRVESGATTVSGPVEVLPASDYEANFYIRETDPDTAAAWTAAGLNAAKAGIKFT